MIMIYMQRIERKTKCKKNKIIRRWKERERGGRNRKREIGRFRDGGGVRGGLGCAATLVS